MWWCCEGSVLVLHNPLHMVSPLLSSLCECAALRAGGQSSEAITPPSGICGI